MNFLKNMNEKDFLERYRVEEYERPSVATDIVIFTILEEKNESYRKLGTKTLSLLLIQRGGHPFLGSWALPGGFVKPNETVAQAANRELQEETNLENIYLEQLYTFSTPERDPRTWVMSVSHLALLSSEHLQIKSGDDAADAKWFTLQYSCSGAIYTISLVNEETILSAVVELNVENPEESRVLENNGLAFDHAKIIAYALERIRRKLEYSQLAFNLVPEKFTLTELQNVYEVILNETLYKAVFRRKIVPYVQETSEYREGVGHRPSKLFVRREAND